MEVASLPQPVPRRLAGAAAVDPSLVLFLAVYALVVLWLAPFELVPDSWLLLVSGREVAQHGLPARDSLVLLAHGRRWIDQQWLAQLLFYGLSRLGLAAALVALAAASTAALGLVAAAARAAGASATSVVVVATAAVLVAPSALQLRAQALALPLFAGLLLLLASEARAPTRRILLVGPLLAVWANVHGSAVVGVALVWLYAATVARTRPRRAAALAATAPALLLATPYGIAVTGYYRSTLGSSAIAHYSQEWQPLSWATGKPFFLFAFASLWLVARHGRRSTVFEQLALVGTLLLALGAARNMVWFAAAAVAVVPPALDGMRRRPLQALARPPAMIVGTAWLAAAFAVAVGVAVSVSPQPRLERRWDASGAAAAAPAAGGLFASDEYADWLLWTHPELRGRLVYDARFELLTRDDLESLSRHRATVAGRYGVAMLDRTQDARVERALLSRGYRIAYGRGELVVLRRRR